MFDITIETKRHKKSAPRLRNTFKNVTVVVEAEIFYLCMKKTVAWSPYPFLLASAIFLSMSTISVFVKYLKISLGSCFQNVIPLVYK